MAVTQYTAEQIAQALASLLPRGPAITREPGTNMHNLLLGLSDEFVRVRERTADLLAESHPNTVSELLDEWEAEFGLPDPCVSEPQTIEERIGALAARVASTGGQSILYYKNLGLSLGLPLTITRSQAFELGRNGMGDPIGGSEWRYHWHVTTTDQATTAQRQALECLFNRLDKAYTIVTFNYEPDAIAPAAPSSISIAAIAGGDGAYNVTWDVSVLAENYELEQSFNNGPWVSVLTTKANAVGFPEEQPPGFYRYRVRALNEYGESDWLESNVFAVGDIAVSWEAAELPNQMWNDVAYSPELGLYVAVSDTASGHEVATSADGKSWTLQSTPNASYRGVCWVSQLMLFVAVASSRIITSPDGINWTQRAAPNGNWQKVFWADALGLFVVVPNNIFGTAMLTSPDGINWTAHSTPAMTAEYAIWSERLQLCVVVGNDDAYLTSPDGENWTVRTMPNSYRSVTDADSLGVLIAVTASFPSKIITSPDGINWTAKAGPDGSYYTSAWAPELSLFLALEGTSSNIYLMTRDGETFTGAATGVAGDWRGVVWSPENFSFVAVGRNGACMLGTPILV